jgi:hypothetical protein
MPNLHCLMEQGAVGLMPVASASDHDPARTWATLGAGKAASGDGPLGTPKPWGKWGVQFDLEAVARANKESHSGATTGALGGLLRFYGMPTAVLAVRDRATTGLPSPSALVLTDESGHLDAYHVLQPVPRRRVRADLADLLRYYPVVLLDLSDLPGDTSAASVGVRPSRRLGPALTKLDRLIGEAMAALGPHKALLLLVSPESPPTAGRETRYLGPVIMWQTDGAVRTGLLTTRSTRWPGLVAASDIAPTVLDSWTIWPLDGRLRVVGPPGGLWQMTGRPLETVPSVAVPAAVDRLDRTLTAHYRWGFTAVKAYVTYCFLVVVAGLILTLWRPGLLPRLRGAALAMSLAPVGMLVAQLGGLHNLYAWLLISVLVTAVMVAIGAAFRRPAVSLAVGMLLGAAAILADTLTGSWLVRTAPFAFPVMSGSRFYGLGNEYMGVLLGLSTVGLAALLELNPARQWVLGVLGGFTVLVIGAPSWGANWGGAVSAAIALVVIWLFSGGARPWRRLLIAVVLVMLSAALPAALDLVLSPSPAQRTHIGSAAAALLSGGLPSLGGIVRRKLAMSVGILTYTPWTIPLAAAALGAFWIFLRRAAPARAALRGQRRLAGGILGAVIGGGVAMVVNDSGIVAGAGAMVCAVSALLVIAGREQREAG